MTGCDEPALRRALFAVTVVDGFDLAPDDRGAWLPAPAGLITWAEWAAALDGGNPATPAGRERLTRYARVRLLAAGRVALTPRPFAVPAGHPNHPGLSWVRHTVPGGILHLGIGIAGLDPTDPERITPLPPEAARAGGRRGAADVATAGGYLARMAELAVARLARHPEDPLRPMGGCDVLTLLAARPFRAALVAGRPGTIRGLRTAAVPSRDRGWLDLRRIDPAFIACAAALTEPADRGFDRPLLVTADELVLAGSRAGYSRRPAEHRRGPTRPGRRS